MPRQVTPPFDGGTLGAFFGESESVRINLVRSDEELIRKLVSMLDNQLLAVLETRSVAEFGETRAAIWPKYIRARRALADTLSNLASESVMEDISKLCFAMLKTDLQKQKGVRFGDKLADQAIFTVWTLGKINTLAHEVNHAGEPSDRDADLKLNSEYQACSLWAQFHLDAIVAAMKFKKTIPDDVQEVICDGLRTAINVHVILQEALDLRVPKKELPLFAMLPWDQEDEELLASSMKDINADFSKSD
ncbi:MAG: hypothetical protein ABSG32_24650 [Terriglobia bacterium]